MKLSDFLSDVGRPIAFYPSLVKALGDRNEAIFICQMSYWRGKGEGKDDWIYKSTEEIESETSLTYKEQKNVRDGLLKKGLLEERYARSEHTMYYRIVWDKVNETWEQFTIGQLPNGRVAVAQREGGSLPLVNSLNSNTENTQENTQESIQNAEEKNGVKKILNIFKDAFGKFHGERELNRFIALAESLGDASKLIEIVEWAFKREIHLSNRGGLLDSLETAAKNWRGKTSAEVRKPKSNRTADALEAYALEQGWAS